MFHFCRQTGVSDGRTIKLRFFSLFLKKDLLFPERRDIIRNASGCGAAGSALDWGSRGRKFKSCHSDHEKSLFCLPRQERFFPAFRAKNKQIYAISGFGAVDRLLRSPIFCVQRRKRSQNAGVLFAVLCRCKERLKRTEGTDLNQLFTKNIHSSKDLITLKC